MSDEKKQPPVIDLHESEWRRDGKHEPILGPNGLYFLIMFPTSLVIYCLVALAVSYLRHLL